MKKTSTITAALVLMSLLLVGAGCSKSSPKISVTNSSAPKIEQQPFTPHRTAQPPTPPPKIPLPKPVSPTGTK